MSETPPTRRNRTRQRGRLLERLRSSDAHPTAADLHRALLSESPRLSLGTVYRNLEVLVAEGNALEVPVARGASRFDGNTDPHHHFVCDSCGAIRDVAVPLPRGFLARLRERERLDARRCRIDFYGLCPTCTDLEQTLPGASIDAP